MLILDEQRVQRNAKGIAQESYADQVNRWTKEQLGSARVIADIDLSPSNPQRQLGTLLPGPQKLEKILTSFSPNFVFEQFSPSKKRMSFRLPNGTLERICVYEAGPTPEYSIMNAMIKWEADPDFALGKRTLQRDEVRGVPVTMQEAFDLVRDLGHDRAMEELLRKRSDSGQNDPDYRPGFKKVLQTWSEAVRGWRSVLVMPLQKGFITLSQARKAVELLGGVEDRASWTASIGAQSNLQKGY